jgi:hypothetical protein
MPGQSDRDNAQRQQLKQAIFDGMSPRRQKHIVKKGFDRWDPFLEPKDPIDIRRDVSRRTTKQLVREYLQGLDQQSYSNIQGQAAMEMAIGIINDDERILSMYRFAVWYSKLLDKEGHEPGSGR